MKRKKNRICQAQRILVYSLIPISLLVSLIPKGNLELWTNQFHHPVLDFFFLYWTNLGDGILFLWLIPILTLKRLSYGIFMCISALLQGIVISICKQGLFKGMPRPIEYLQGIDFYQVPGLNLHHWNSFPSGHTATAMGIAAGLMIIYYKDRRLKHAFLLTGLLVAFSRVYLMQHFYIDILVGSLVGISCTWVARELTLRYFSKKIFRKSLFKTKPSKTRTRKIKQQITAKRASA
ncbi:phosphatase PAP2 family protein [Algoriphagus halophytocola]|uniref:phosphatase PAP2 family protein n=1 Tax=Algoriphagus halophytocola TaxID=2991499 RepID=UPI0037C19A06